MSTIKVTEIYGPVMQGEGPAIGLPTLFIRTAGCGFRCSWCDSMYSVLPIYYEKTVKKYAAHELIDIVLRKRIPTVTLSGGDPALYDFSQFVHHMRWATKVRTIVETQGQLWPEWFKNVDYLVVSLKPPSAKMSKYMTGDFLQQAFQKAKELRNLYFKTVVDPYDLDDVQFAEEIIANVRCNSNEFYLQPVWLPEETHTQAASKVSRLVEHFGKLGPRVRIIPQVHKLLYGDQRGV